MHLFQLEKPTLVLCTNTNPRRELHGEEHVRAIDLTFCLSGENTLLDLLHPGLRAHHFHNAAFDAQQEPLPLGVELPLPDVRWPKLQHAYQWGTKQDKSRGYRWIWDWGTEDEHVDFTDVVVGGYRYEFQQGGTAKLWFTVQYNGEELANNALYGELSGLATQGEISMKLLAPAQLLSVAKGYRAGKVDTPVTKLKNPNQADLPDGEQQQEEQEEDEGAQVGHAGNPGAFVASNDDDVLQPGSPEAALAASEGATKSRKKK
jgi:hypothetical protein